MNLRQIAAGGCLVLLTSTAAHAEFFGLLNGRSANQGSAPPLSVEGAFITGDNYQHIGGRVNYKLSPDLTLFGDLGQSEIGEGFFDIDGLAFGIGAFYQLANQQMLEDFDVAVKGSFHSATLEYSNSNFEIDGTNISLEAIVSGREALTPGGLMWYANGGLNILGGDFDENELLLGGGVYMPAGPGEFYAGADLIDKLQFGIGYRYFVQ